MGEDFKRMFPSRLPPGTFFKTSSGAKELQGGPARNSLKPRAAPVQAARDPGRGLEAARGALAPEPI